MALGAAVLVSLVACRDAPAPAVPRPALDPVLARFSLAEPLERRWSDELIHFDVDLPASTVHLRDARGAPLPAEIEITAREGGRTRGRVWTVLTLDPNETASIEVRAGSAPPVAGAVSVRREPGAIVLANDRIEITVPRWSGAVSDVRALPPPIRAVRRAQGAWIGEAAWTSDEAAPAVSEAVTEIVSEGPVRVIVQQRLRFADGRAYRALITLAAKQEAALVTEDADAVLPKTGYRLSLPGSVVWRNHFAAAEGAPPWHLIETPVAASREALVCKLRPWSFWWLPRLCEWAGFRPEGSDTLVGVLAVRPSRWTPSGWDGFERTQLPIQGHPGGRAEVSFNLTARADKPLHREWALTATAPPAEDTPAARERTLRAQLVKYAEFPLDDVKEWGFDAKIAPRPHPSLLFDRAALAQARKQAAANPVLAARVRADIELVERCGDLEPALQKDGPLGIYKSYAHHDLVETLPELMLATEDPRYTRWLTGVVEGLARRVVRVFMDAPERSALGGYGPWFSEEVTRLVLNWDLVADKLSPEREAAVRRVMIFGAHVLSHPDYWNVEAGLQSGNPNMRSSILLPRGLLGIALAGHPEAEGWLRGAEEELHRELTEWVMPGGAWVEAPGYQAASLDAIFLLSAAIKNGTDRDPFATPQFRETLDFYGFLLTPPDRRFSLRGADTPMVIPSVGQTYSGWISPFNGWMAAATAKSDPAYAARQQFFWKRQATMYGNGGRAKGFYPALTDATLPEAPPAETSRGFPGFGSILRSSWTDPRHSYVAHRTGPTYAHYAYGEHGSIVYYAKGAPLCLDWGNVYSPVLRGEGYYHNTVSFGWGSQDRPMTGDLLGVQSLPGFAELSQGVTRAGSVTQTKARPESFRHLLMVESADPLGANYLVIRDHTVDDKPGDKYSYNLFCLSREPVIREGKAHFPGQMGVDLDAFVLAPAKAPMTTDHWGWKQVIYAWGNFSEEQYGIHVTKEGSRDDFFTVLYPRAAGEREPVVRAVAGGAAARVEHGEGTDVVLLSPGNGTVVREGGAALAGEIAMARRHRRGAIRLAVMGNGDTSAELDGWGVRSAGPVAMEISGAKASGASSGPAREIVVTLPPSMGEVTVQIDGAPAAGERKGRSLSIAVPAGAHRFTVARR
ncbi:Hypothetical protein A7982_05412 [Minicystis rosea]|nr:Hypothetical protein A7982_05412 [Minicystis rosea]